MTPPRRTALMREQRPGGHAPVGYMELFFDLVYVFAITQLSHALLARLDWTGALQTALLFFAVWWAWMFTTWVTNWVDPDRGANRLMLCMVMIGSLVMASTIPQAFGKHGLVFAGAYVATQIGRSLYASWAMGEWRRGSRQTLLRIAVWFCVSAVPWIIGGLADTAEARMLWWLGALTIEYLGPICYFRVPGMQRFRSEDWDISGGHMAERCALFTIIALGEGVVIIGATFAGLEPDAATITAFLAAFLGSFAMWWVYFDVGARRGVEHIEHHDSPGLVARQAFTYWHIPIVAGIVLMAVGDELTLTHPVAPAHPDFVIVVTAGMMLFLWGAMNFKKISNGVRWYPLSHTVGVALSAMLGIWGWLAHPATLLLYALSAGVFALVALWEWGSYHGGWVERAEAHAGPIGRMLRRHSEKVIARRNARRP